MIDREHQFVVNYKNITVKTTDGSVTTGKINILSFGRLSEYLKQGTDKFITIISEKTDEAHNKITIVNREYIIWANTWD